MQVQGDEVVLRFGDRRWRVRGLGKNAAVEQLRVNVLVSRERQSAEGSGFFVDTLDLYTARQRLRFVKQAAEELGGRRGGAQARPRPGAAQPRGAAGAAAQGGARAEEQGAAS